MHQRLQLRGSGPEGWWFKFTISEYFLGQAGHTLRLPPVKSLFCAKKKNGDADAVLHTSGCGAEKEVGKEAMAVSAHGHEVAGFFLHPLDDFLGGIPESKFRIGGNS